jgi:tRNA nucleotidyltransferase (CCA-adding enzyme)
MNIISTHKNTDFDALASVVAAAILYPDAITILPGILNPNVRAFISLHKDFFEFCPPDKVDLKKVERLIVVDTNSWQRLDRLDGLKEKKNLDIHLYGFCPVDRQLTKGCKDQFPMLQT